MRNELDLLIVDDEQYIGDTMLEHIARYNLKTKFVTKVQDAIDVIKKQRPKVVIVDIFLPELDGFDLAEEIYSYARDAKIILMSGIYDFKKEHLSQLGFEDFLRKPIDFALLDELLKKYKLIEQ
ncbi:MAG: response regulator [Candidatus Omnitrophica bacterium]|nr:response regulator [Candidatus Omnitrophota bacterium]